MSSQKNFVFDVVVTHFEAPALKLQDPRKVKIDVKFNNFSVPITSSRINITEFNPNYGYEFKSTPKTIRKNVENCGMLVNVNYNNRPIGKGQIVLPQSFFDRITEDMSDLMHSDSCNFERDGKVLGTVEVLFRLIIKCEDIPMDGETKCRDVDKSISPHDIMFVMGESQFCPGQCDNCPDVLDEDDGRLELDLQRYKRSDIGTSRPTETFMRNPVGNSACRQLQDMVRECENIVDDITLRTGHPKPFIASSRRTEEEQNNSNDKGDQPTSSTAPCFSYLPARQGNSPDFCDPSLIPMPISDLSNPQIKPKRFCPVCLTNMSWLPKFAACPKCGVKPMPVVEERHKEKKLTAENVLQEFLGKTKTTDDDFCVNPCSTTQNEQEEKACRCTCKSGQLCAHCRIRKLCADIFKADDNTVECPKVNPSSSEDFCIRENDLQNCKPHLARVFSELRDLYDIKESGRESKMEIACKLNQKSSHPKIEKNHTKDKVKQKFIVLEGSRKMNTTDVKKLPTTRVGHKNCIVQKGAVSRRHGWDWSCTPEARQHGWRPGWILKPIKKLMHFFLQYLPEDKALNSNKTAEKLERTKKYGQPSLNVCKSNGEIFITLRDLNESNTETKPITFKVVKSDFAVALREIKQAVKDQGFPKCTCHKPVMLCCCRSNSEKYELEDLIKNECNSRRMQSCVDQLVLTDTSESEMEFDFEVTPPAGTMNASTSLKQGTFNQSTQTSKKDKTIPAEYPKHLGPYWRTYDCAAGDRYTGTAFGNPGEAVFEDGVFGHRGGGPHGPSAAPGSKPKSKGVWGASPGGPMRGGEGIAPGGKLGGMPFPGAKNSGAGGVGGAGQWGGAGGAGGAGKWGGAGGAGGIGGAGGAGGAGGTGGAGGAGKWGGFGGAGGADRAGGNQQIPVRMPKRFAKAEKDAEKVRQETLAKNAAKKKKGTDMMKYIKKNNLHKYNKIGPDGLTDAQRRRKNLLSSPLPQLETIPRLGCGYDPQTACNCYNPCVNNCSYSCGYYC